MKYPNVNIFAAWFFMAQTIAMGWVAAAGNILLQMLGVPVQEGFIPGRIVGALLLLFAIYLVWHFMHVLPPRGQPDGNGYKPGHRLVMGGNILAGLLFVFQFFAAGIESHNIHLVLDKFTTSFGYLSLGCFAIGLSLIYQSALPLEKNS